MTATDDAACWLQVGDYVTTDFNKHEAARVRRVLAIRKTPHTQSGWSANVEGIPHEIDVAWCFPIKDDAA